MTTRARESALWAWLRVVKPRPTPLHWHRIEDILNRGTPDVEGCYVSIGFDVELKSVQKRRDGTVWCELRPEQAMYLRARRRAGGRAFVLIQVGPNERYLVDGMDSDKLLLPIALLELGLLSKIRSDANQEEILDAIVYG